MPDAATIKELISGGVGVIAMAVLVFFIWMQTKERTTTIATIERVATKASEALDRNTAAISKLESAVEKLESRLDDHDRMLERVGVNRGMS